MKQQRRRKCKCCRELFEADRRNVRHQQFCSKLECRLKSKRESQARWRRKPENQSYFSGSHHVERVRTWRAAHPGYWKKGALQDDLCVQIPEDNKESGNYNSPMPGYLSQNSAPAATTEANNNNQLPNHAGQGSQRSALQDILPVENIGQSAVLIGLISKLTGTALQDDIASTAIALLRLGQDILNGAGGNDREATLGARSGTTDSKRELFLG